jgi:hypothetical protein
MPRAFAADVSLMSRWKLLVLLVAVAATIVVATRTSPVAEAGPHRAATIRFGIYPGGDAGAVDGVARAPEVDEAQRLAMIRRLRAGRRSFVLHEYAAYHDAGSIEGARIHLERVLADAAATGSQAEIVLRYQPTARDPAVDLPGYERFVRAVVREFGGRSGLVGVQITNEANVPGAPDAADGDFPGVRDALVRGVDAAAEERAALGRRRLAIGFNVARDARTPDFWPQLARTGGSGFARNVDYVGLDIYPGTWPTQVKRPPSPRAVRTTVHGALRKLRRDMVRAGLGRRVAVHLSEAGYPTGPGRSEAVQAKVMKAVTDAAVQARTRYGVSDFRWFDLRDADSSSTDFQHQYGVLRDDLVPKPAFAVLQRAIRLHGGR